MTTTASPLELEAKAPKPVPCSGCRSAETCYVYTPIPGPVTVAVECWNCHATGEFVDFPDLARAAARWDELQRQLSSLRGAVAAVLAKYGLADDGHDAEMRQLIECLAPLNAHHALLYQATHSALCSVYDVYVHTSEEAARWATIARELVTALKAEAGCR